MAQHIHGPLYYERMGRRGPVIAFVHPNPMDQSCWIFQLAHLSTWYRCIAIDIPGYGRSPKADAGLTMTDMAEACWEAIDDAVPGENAILVGCSVGSSIVPYMYHQRTDKTAALVLSGTGYNPTKEFTKRRIDAYTANGINYRWRYTFEDLSPAFRTTPLAHFFATIILTGSEDSTHQSAFALKARIPNCELKVLPGAGHACQMEQPWLFDRFMIEFLADHGLFPGASKPAKSIV